MVNHLFCSLIYFSLFSGINDRPLYFGYYGRNADWGLCWIRNESTGENSKELPEYLMELCCFYVPLYLAIIYNFWSYHHILNFAQKNMVDEKEINFLRKLSFYPWVTLMC